MNGVVNLIYTYWNREIDVKVTVKVAEMLSIFRLIYFPESRLIHVYFIYSYSRLEMRESFTRRRINFLYVACRLVFLYCCNHRFNLNSNIISDSSYFDMALSLLFSTPTWTEGLQWAPRRYIGGCCSGCGCSPTVEWITLRNVDVQGFSSACNASGNRGQIFIK
jgi:hypothetical protein